jgi:predicted nucleic acid-binding protein
VGAGVLDAGIAIGWIRGGHRSAARIDALLRDARTGRRVLYISAVNLAEVLLHTGEWSRLTGGDAVALLRSWGVRIHTPDEAVARRVARLDTSLPDGFAAATAQELGARLHTTDGELARRLRGRTPPVTLY